MLVRTDLQSKYCKIQRLVKPLSGNLRETYELENRDLSIAEMFRACYFIRSSRLAVNLAKLGRYWQGNSGRSRRSVRST
jgi:hypothetical protein